MRYTEFALHNSKFHDISSYKNNNTLHNINKSSFNVQLILELRHVFLFQYKNGEHLSNLVAREVYGIRFTQF